MDAALFLEQFGHVAESPGGVPKLRRLILEVAVRGQLVPQNPDDEPASEILKRIEAEKKLSPIGNDEIFYKVPDNWAWGRLGEVSEIISGSTPKSDVAEYWDGNIVWITPTDLGRLKSKYINGSDRLISPEGYASCSATLMPAGSVVMSSRAPIGHLGIANVELCTNQGCKSFVPEEGVSSNYLYFALKAFVGQIKTLGSGTTFTEVSKTKLIPFLIPLPPVAEQQRIVAKVDELMALCDQLEAEQTERDHLRERTAKSTLFHLTDAPTRTEARRYWQYAEQHFPHLFDRYATVAELRATILQLAVQGRLVPQNPDDQPADELLERILIERRERWEAQALSEYRDKDKTPPEGWEKRYKQHGSPDTTELPTLPENWVWVYLGQVVWSVKDGPHYSPRYTSSGIPFITGGNIRPDGVDFRNVKYITPELHEELSKRCKPELGDILYTKGGTTGIARVNTYEFDFNVWVHVAVLKLVKSINPFYVQLALNSPFCYEQSQNLTHGIGNKDLGLTRMVNIIMPLPPINMQERILAKVNELMALCDQLEAQADACQALSGRLFDSIVYHLFADN